MLVPRFSLRWLLLAITVFAVLSLIVSIAVHEQSAWAIGLTGAVGSAAVLFLLFAATFLISQWFSLLGRLIRPAESGASPFADAGRPVQIIPPQEPE